MPTPRDAFLEAWRWLPVFRSVAEVESVTRAGVALNLSPSAVSRAVARLEATLNRKLFVRTKNRLVLNDHGLRLLKAVGDASEQVANAMEDLSARELSGTVRVATFGHLGRSVILRTARRLAVDSPRVDLDVSYLEPDVALAALEQRTLDLYAALNVAVGAPLVATQLTEVDHSIYCGKGHPLFSGPLPSQATVLKHGFVIGATSKLMRSVWPKHLERKISLRVGPHAIAMDACLEGAHLAALDKVTAHPYVEDGRLRELPVVSFEKARLVVCRRADGEQRVLREVLRAMSASVAEIANPVST